MIYDLDIAKKIAESLLQINAIILQPHKPFKWASGWNSPIYCDNRKTLSYPEIRTHIKQGLSAIIKTHYSGTNIIAGVATAGIPHGALVAEETGKPFIYIRSKAKEHGKQNQIEGVYEEGNSVVLIEDLISSGKSSLEAAETLKRKGMIVKSIVSIFNYGFDEAKENFKSKNTEFISLCDYKILLQKAIEQKFINENDLDILESWRSDPKNW
tara:strand:- start:6690 stop:7325 length:636 start_codon:yes stop_codon:yes gene_type:complete